MKIENIIKSNQPKEFSKLKTKSKRHSNPKELTEKDIEELMGHSSYKRGKHGIRQVR